MHFVSWLSGLKEAGILSFTTEDVILRAEIPLEKLDPSIENKICLVFWGNFGVWDVTEVYKMFNRLPVADVPGGKKNTSTDNTFV